MTAQEILEFTILQIDGYRITVYKIVSIVLILILTAFLLRGVKSLFLKQQKMGRLDVGKSNSLFQIFKYIIWITAIAMSLRTIGLRLTILMAGSAALLVGLGFGLQHVFNDWISGLILLIDGTIKVDDIIEFEDGSVSKVKEIGLRTSKVISRDNIISIVPNSKLVNDRVINWNHVEDKTRFSVEVGVAYGSDVLLVKEVLLECANNHKDIEKNPKPTVNFTNFGDSSLDFKLLFWTNKSFQIEVIQSDLRFEIDRMFRAKNITIPFPQRDVHIKNN